MDTQTLQDELLHLVGFMLTSARGLYEEPPSYGSFRLLDAAGRLLAIMEDQGLLTPFLAGLKTQVDAERAGSMDDDRQRQMLEAAVLQIAEELRRAQSA